MEITLFGAAYRYGTPAVRTAGVHGVLNGCCSGERTGQAADVLLELLEDDDEEGPDAVVPVEVDGLLLSPDLVSEPPLLGAGALLVDDPRLSVR
jgi:hypothetical protein